MNVYKVIQSQYLAALEMMRRVIEKCPEDVWAAEKDKNRFWHVAFHALFYLHLYLQPTEADFVPWEGANPEHRSLGSPEQLEGTEEPYTKAELLEFVAFSREQILAIVPKLDLHGESGFSWLPFSKLEIQFYNMRHLTQHTGELMERLWVDAGIEIHWVGTQSVDG